MKAECERDFWPITEKCEGKVYCLYLDVLGLVTTAIGNLCHNIHVAMSLPFMRPDGTRATPDDIAAEHRHVAAQFCGMKGAEEPKKGKVCPWRSLGKSCLAHRGWHAAMLATKLRLTDAGVKQIVMAKMREHDAHLLQQYPAFESWPWQAQLATHLMAWACGSGFGGSHPGGYPRLKKLLLAGDFAKAATECHINEAGNPGVIQRNVKIKALYKEAASVQNPDTSTTNEHGFDLDTTEGVQAALSRLGHDPGPIDGIPGKKTKAALVTFQAARGLKPDGILGPKTRSMLDFALTTSA